MIYLHGFFAFLLLASQPSAAQQTALPVSQQDAAASNAVVKTNTAVDGETEPVLLSSYKVNPPVVKCKGNSNYSVNFSVVVDDTGRPRNLFFLSALGNELDELALQIAESDQFTPRTKDGSPVAVAETLEIQIDACVEHTRDGKGKKIDILHVKSQPTQTLRRRAESADAQLAPVAAPPSSNSQDEPQEVAKVGREVTAPSILRATEPTYSDEAREKKIQGVCVVSLIVDAHGMPRNEKITKGLGYGLDEQAIAAVHKFRFKPGTKNGTPVATYAYIEVNFRLY